MSTTSTAAPRRSTTPPRRASTPAPAATPRRKPTKVYTLYEGWRGPTPQSICYEYSPRMYVVAAVSVRQAVYLAANRRWWDGRTGLLEFWDANHRVRRIDGVHEFGPGEFGSSRKPHAFTESMRGAAEVRRKVALAADRHMQQEAEARGREMQAADEARTFEREMASLVAEMAAAE